MRLIETNDEPLFSRTKYVFEDTFKGSVPSRLDYKNQIAKETKNDPNLVIVYKIRTFFGKRKAIITAYSYKDEKILKKLTPKYLMKRNGLIKEKKEE